MFRMARRVYPGTAVRACSETLHRCLHYLEISASVANNCEAALALEAVIDSLGWTPEESFKAGSFQAITDCLKLVERSESGAVLAEIRNRLAASGLWIKPGSE